MQQTCIKAKDSLAVLQSESTSSRLNNIRITACFNAEATDYCSQNSGSQYKTLDLSSASYLISCMLGHIVTTQNRSM